MAETTTVAGVYASALLEVAQEKKQLDEVLAELDELTRALTGDQQISDFLRTPNIGREAKIQVIKKVLGDKASPILRNFMTTLIRRDRQEALSEIHSEFVDLYRRAKGLVVVEVKTAVKLDDQQRRKLEKALGEKYKRGVVIKETVDPSLIGGLQIESDGDFIDGSLKQRLRQVHALLRHAKVNSGEFYED